MVRGLAGLSQPGISPLSTQHTGQLFLMAGSLGRPTGKTLFWFSTELQGAPAHLESPSPPFMHTLVGTQEYVSLLIKKKSQRLFSDKIWVGFFLTTVDQFILSSFYRA
jgi:hypothetical protein